VNNISCVFLWLFKEKLVTLRCELLSLTFNYVVVMQLSQNVKNCIYRLVFPDGKYYVGKTKDLRRRVHLYERKVKDLDDTSRVVTALREFGIENVGVEVLTSVSSCSESDIELCLSILEIKYIREQDCIYPKGYNASIGGELLGIPADVIEMKFGVNATGYAGKSILVYDVEGNFVSEYTSVAKCAYGLGVSEKDVRYSLDKVGKILKNTYMLREKKYGEVPKKILSFKPEVVVRRRAKTEYDVVTEKVYKKKELTTAAIMYDKNGDFVGLFDNARKSRQYLMMEDTKMPFGREFRGVYIFHYNGGEIKQHLGAFKSKNLTTMFYDDILALGDVENIGERISLVLEPVPEKEKDVVEKNPKVVVKREPKPRVEKYTLDGQYVCTYKNAVHAAADNNVYSSAIHSCAKKKTRRCGDFIYRYEGDTLDLPDFSASTLQKRLFD